MERGYPSGGSPLAGLARIRDAVTRRESSWDRTGGNKDCIVVPSRSKRAFCELEGPGCIRHIWITISCNADPLYLRKVLLRFYWDDEKRPSVEAPVGDFFGVGHAVAKHFVSLPLNMVARPGRGNQAGMNCYFPMPFRKGARLEVENQGKGDVDAFFFYVDYEQYPELEEDVGYFHAQWRRENPCKRKVYPKRKGQLLADTSNEVNLDGKDNYVLLDAKGRGHYVGSVLSVDNAEAFTQNNTWFGEGDDMIFVDGERPFRLPSTGRARRITSARPGDFPAASTPGPITGCPWRATSRSGRASGASIVFTSRIPSTFERPCA